MILFVKGKVLILLRAAVVVFSAQCYGDEY